MGARTLACERLVEEAAVVQTGQRVEVCQLPRLAEPACVLDRRAGAHRECLELPHVVVGELVPLRAREDGEVPERLSVAGQRHREAGVDDSAFVVNRRPPLLLGVRVRHRDRAG